MSTSQEEIRSPNIHMAAGHSSPPHAESPVIAVLASLILLHERILASRINLLMVSD